MESQNKSSENAISISWGLLMTSRNNFPLASKILRYTRFAWNIPQLYFVEMNPVGDLLSYKTECDGFSRLNHVLPLSSHLTFRKLLLSGWITKHIHCVFSNSSRMMFLSEQCTENLTLLSKMVVQLVVNPLRMVRMLRCVLS